MKSIFVGCLVVVCSLCYAQTDSVKIEMGRKILAAAARDAYRKVDGNLYDLTPRFRWADPDIETSGIGCPLPDWEIAFGRVLQVQPDGILLRKYASKDLLMQGDYTLVFVKNYTKAVVDDSRVSFYAMQAGRHQYTTTQGATKTVLAYDYGIIPSSQEITNLVKAAEEKLEAEQRRQADLATARNAASAEKRVKQRAVELKHHQALADKGDAYGLYRMGKRYIEADGVDEDLVKGRALLNRAAAAGSIEAREFLRRLTNAPSRN